MVIIKKELLILSLVIFILINISCINAIEINETSDGCISILTDSADDFSALSDEINAQNTKEIKLTKNYIFNQNSDEEFVEGISINTDDLVIDGQNHTIDANNKARILNIKSNNVVLKNINF